MSDNHIYIEFDQKKTIASDFDIISLESILRDSEPHKIHRINFYAILVITDGEGIHTIDFKNYAYSKGEILTLKKGQVHQFHKSNAKGYILLLTEEYMANLFNNDSSVNSSELLNENLFMQHNLLGITEFDSFIQLVQQLKVELETTISQETNKIILHFLQILFLKIKQIRHTSIVPEIETQYIPKFIEFQELVEEFHPTSRSVKYFADKLKVTSKQLNLITHNICNETAKKVIDEITLLCIKRLLINQELSVKDVAVKTGFLEANNFFKFFKKNAIQTPYNFKNLYK
ncbi:helix-turn-helix domain-containing protein [Flammeovirga kamogawensis]|uniref:AraC family transcriptional regulator n=1 Tax=Flammeovirga kamogawensis TaxID=373891 RepID=A0ABX8GV18_9BACT|nr:helix-turn-helix domain-containing protein [Flammeovirga kamogawensis]MBB6459690.1 AraC-like DNA-binding protein [Flammeovirga kamogawensis]QWG07248.1 AraC family transcriptional regulator [Flammeovirga kamogawensis]TRX69068.1 AraC family transcriptional regulator [Flammeovirga kamogawensis]